MTDDLRFDIAVSYAGATSGIAKDLHELVVRQGLSIYCYSIYPDSTAGFLRDNLQEIYRASRLNVLLWSQHYAAGGPHSITAMELRTLAQRHVEGGESRTLFIVRVDGCGLAPPIDRLLFHDLTQVGILELSRWLVERVRREAAKQASGTLVRHPANATADRGRLQRCEFEIDPAFRNDPRQRWETLADVLAIFPNPLRTQHVYLIPSGACSPLFRNADLLKTDPDRRLAKRLVTEAWAQRRLGSRLTGFWFPMQRGDAAITTLYAPAYDAALNESLAEGL